jgi:hypothetical protein
MPGGWYIDYYVKGVCKRKKIGSSNQVAELALTQVQVKIAKGEYLGIHEEKKLTFRQFAPEYLAYLGRDAVRERHETTGFYKWPHRDSNSGFCRERANYGTDRTHRFCNYLQNPPFFSVAFMLSNSYIDYVEFHALRSLVASLWTPATIHSSGSMRASRHAYF